MFFLTTFCSSILDAATVEVSYNPNSESNMAGYRIYYGTTSRIYDHVIDVGLTTSYDVMGLQEGTTYYLAVTAYNTGNSESDYSPEVTVTIPITGPTTDLDPDHVSDGAELPDDSGTTTTPTEPISEETYEWVGVGYNADTGIIYSSVDYAPSSTVWYVHNLQFYEGEYLHIYGDAQYDRLDATNPQTNLAFVLLGFSDGLKSSNEVSVLVNDTRKHFDVWLKPDELKGDLLVDHGLQAGDINLFNVVIEYAKPPVEMPNDLFVTGVYTKRNTAAYHSVLVTCPEVAGADFYRFEASYNPDGSSPYWEVDIEENLNYIDMYADTTGTIKPAYIFVSVGKNEVVGPKRMLAHLPGNVVGTSREGFLFHELAVGADDKAYAISMLNKYVVPDNGAPADKTQLINYVPDARITTADYAKENLQLNNQPRMPLGTR